MYIDNKRVFYNTIPFLDLFCRYALGLYPRNQSYQYHYEDAVAEMQWPKGLKWRQHLTDIKQKALQT